MFLRIERGSGVPISRQIAEQIRAQCAAGSLQPEQRLPSVRQLARELAVNQNTVLRVYERLAGEGYLDVRHGEGTFIATGQPKLGAEQRDHFRDELRRITRQGQLLGLAPAELQELFTEVLDEISAQPTSATSTTGDQS